MCIGRDLLMSYHGNPGELKYTFEGAPEFTKRPDSSFAFCHQDGRETRRLSCLTGGCAGAANLRMLMGRWNVSVTSVSTAYNSELVYGAAVGHQLAVSCESGATTAVSRLRGHLFQFGEILAASADATSFSLESAQLASVLRKRIS